MFLILGLMCVAFLVDTAKGISNKDPTMFKMSAKEKEELKLKTMEMFDHAYNSYQKYAHPADELMPLSCRGRFRGSEKSRGDIDEALGNFSLTLIDTLDTLVVLGKVDEFEKQVRYVINHVNFNADVVVSVFETNIRVLGGLLGAHSMAMALKDAGKGMSWYTDQLVPKAVDIGDRLLKAFNTSTGIPYPKINLQHGLDKTKSRVAQETVTCTACAGTMIMEFGALSRITGNQIYENKAHKAMEALWRFRNRISDLVGTTINIHNGSWIRRDSGIGAGIDSYYEYCLKAYILFSDESYLEKFNTHYEAINRYVRKGSMLVDVMMHQPQHPVRSHMDALQAFWPGLLVLKGDLQSAIETHEMLYTVAKKYKFLPEAFTTDLNLHWAQHPLRPEFIESTYFLYQATKDDYYLHAGKHVLETLEKHARVKCGYAALKDLRTFRHEDKMDSFVLAETFKYLYLLFSEESEHVVDIHDFVFTTEAHLLPLSLASFPNQRQENITTEARVNLTLEQNSCPNLAGSFKSMQSFPEIVRLNANKRPLHAPKPQCNPSLNKNKDSSIFSLREEEGENIKITFTGERKLRAEEFQVGNEEHVSILRELGISIVKTNDDKVQLVQQAGAAATQQDAQEGIIFMQEMILLAKQKGQNADIQPRYVHVKLDGKPTVLTAGSAQFGPDLDKLNLSVSGRGVETKPYRACQTVNNGKELTNRVAIIERSECMFIDKVRLAQRYGALGVIIVDHIPGTTSTSNNLFGMSGDSPSQEVDDITIPSVFLYHVEGERLRRAVGEADDSELEILITHKDTVEENKDKEEEKKKMPAISESFEEEIRKAREKAEASNEKMAPIGMPTESVVINQDGSKTVTTVQEFVKVVENGDVKRVTHTMTKSCPTLRCDRGVTVNVKTQEDDYLEAVLNKQSNKILSADSTLLKQNENVLADNLATKQAESDKNDDNSALNKDELAAKNNADLFEEYDSGIDNAVEELKVMTSKLLKDLGVIKDKIVDGASKLKNTVNEEKNKELNEPSSQTRLDAKTPNPDL